MTEHNFKLIIPNDLKPKPNEYELIVAGLLADRFTSNIRFVRRGTQTTPDIEIIKTRKLWEIKNIRGNSKHTIADNLRKAARQSPYVVISLLKPTKMTTEQAVARIRDFMKLKSPIKQVLLVTKDRKIIDVIEKV